MPQMNLNPFNFSNMFIILSLYFKKTSSLAQKLLILFLQYSPHISLQLLFFLDI